MVTSRFPIVRGLDPQQSRVQDNVSALLGPLAQRLNDTPIMGAPAPAWVKPSLLNTFTQHATDAPLQFHKDALGYVHVSGNVSSPAGIAAGTSICVLPLGYRTLKQHTFPALSAAFAAQGVRLTTAGALQNTVLIGGAGGSIHIELTFLAEA